MKKLPVTAVIVLAATLGGCSTEVTVRTCDADIPAGVIATGNVESLIDLPLILNVTAGSVAKRHPFHIEAGTMPADDEMEPGAAGKSRLFSMSREGTGDRSDVGAVIVLAEDAMHTIDTGLSPAGYVHDPGNTPEHVKGIATPIFEIRIGLGGTLVFTHLGRPGKHPRACAVRTRLSIPIPVRSPLSIIRIPRTITFNAVFGSVKFTSMTPGFTVSYHL